jgi:prepilin-type N-terminal cleavage/methylation domain-containing protein
MRQISKHTDFSARERGDTLVEVLIAIVIVATVIGGAYVVSNRSLQATRGAQERSTALKLAEAQFEQLKGLVTTDATQIFGVGKPLKFCLASDATGTHVYNTAVPAEKVRCTVDANGVPSTVQPSWTYEVTRTANDFKLAETWTDISGAYTDSLQLNYRVYQP